MLSEDQLKAINLKAQIMSNLYLDEDLDVKLLKEFLILEGNMSDVQQMDSFFMIVLDVLKNSESKMFSNIDIEDIFKKLSSDENIVSFYFEFLDFMVNDNPEVELLERLNKLLEIDYNTVPIVSEIRKLYLYQTLSLALSNHPLNIELINKLNRELTELNNLLKN